MSNLLNKYTGIALTQLVRHCHHRSLQRMVMTEAPSVPTDILGPSDSARPACT